MARGINKVILVGNLGQDVDIRYSADGRPFGTLRIATTNSWYSRETETREERTEWHSVKVFGKLAEIAESYLRKGKQVYIEGRLQTRKYEKDGENRYVTEVVANEMLLLSDRDRGDGAAPRERKAEARGDDGAGAREAAASKSDFGGSSDQVASDFEEDLPF